MRFISHRKDTEHPISSVLSSAEGCFHMAHSTHSRYIQELPTPNPVLKGRSCSATCRIPLGLTSGSFTIHSTICCARLWFRVPPRYHVFQIVSRGCDRHFQWLRMWSRSLTFPGNQNVWIIAKKIRLLRRLSYIYIYYIIYNTSIGTHNMICT